MLDIQIKNWRKELCDLGLNKEEIKRSIQRRRVWRQQGRMWRRQEHITETGLKEIWDRQLIKQTLPPSPEQSLDFFTSQGSWSGLQLIFHLSLIAIWKTLTRFWMQIRGHGHSVAWVSLGYYTNQFIRNTLWAPPLSLEEGRKVRTWSKMWD